MNDLSQRIAALTQEQRELLRARLCAKKPQLASLESALRAAGASPRQTGQRYPLSYIQERLWFLAQIHSDHAAYHRSLCFRIKGNLQPELLERALNLIVSRHETLRTAIVVSEEGKPFQMVLSEMQFVLSQIHLNASSADQAAPTVRALCEAEIARPFQLDRPPLFRVLLIRSAEQDYVLLLVFHHLISDGWSDSIFLQELAQFYQELEQGTAPGLPPLRSQYIDYALQQREKISAGLLEHQLSLRVQKLAAVPPVLALPTDYARPRIEQLAGSGVKVAVPPAVTEGLDRLAQSENTTLFSVVLAAFGLLLARLCGEERIIVGTIHANRDTLDSERMIGVFANTLVFQLDFSGNPTFRRLLHTVRAEMLEVFNAHYLPFDRLIEKLGIQRSLGHPPLVQVLCALQNRPPVSLSFGRFEVTPLQSASKTAQFELTLSLIPHNGGLVGQFEYKTSLFKQETVLQLEAQLQCLLREIAADPSARIDYYPAGLTESSYAGHTLRHGPVALPAQDTIVSFFAAQAKKTPERIAVQDRRLQLSYRVLCVLVDRFATGLRRAGLKRGERAGVLMNRSPHLVAALLGILKVGAAYVPLDRLHPPERLAWMTKEAAIKLMMVEGNLEDLAPLVACPMVQYATLLNQSQFWGEPADTPDAIAPEDLAYLIFTSGSTGKPKGVGIAHGAVGNFLNSMRLCPGLSPDDRLLALTTICFDISILEMFLPLCVGACVIIGSREDATDPERLSAAVDHWKPTVIQGTPALVRLLVNHCPDGHDLRIFCGGEALSSELAREVTQGRGWKLWNLYGPTETTVWSTVGTVDPAGQAISIGEPIHNTSIYLLDRWLKPVSLGAIGEIYIGGEGLARGYWNAPDLTAERFLPDPFRALPGARMYRTGDLARCHPGSQIEFLGRRDSQVKVRGYRIELGEIEAALNRYSGVSKSAAVVTPRGQLLAYLEADPEQLDLKNLQAWLKETLPEYMVPARLVPLRRFPLNPSGKVDRAKLRDLEPAAFGSSAPWQPRNHLEVALQDIWRDLLEVQSWDENASFFELGGHSLLAAELIFRVRKLLGKQIDLRTLFENPTISAFAEAVQKTVTNPKQAGQIAQLEADIRLALTPAPPQIIRLAFKRAFLTGATGFLGAYLLRDLVQSGVQEVFCLVRAQTEAEARARLRANLEKYALWTEAVEHAIRPVTGALDRPMFGLPAAEFARLSERIDFVLSNGAAVNFAQPYLTLRPTNVLGIYEIIRLAMHGPWKPLHHISTIYVAGGNGGGPIMENTRFPIDKILEHNGYTQSKWVAERMLELAKEEGLPVNIYRPGRLAGDSNFGRNSESDLLNIVLKACLEIGFFPEIDFELEVTPVDLCSQAVVAILLNPQALNHNFHTIYPIRIGMGEMRDALSQAGCRFQTASLEEWHQKLMAVANERKSSHVTLAAALAGALQVSDSAAHFDRSNALAFGPKNAANHSSVKAKLLAAYARSLNAPRQKQGPELAIHSHS